MKDEQIPVHQLEHAEPTVIHHPEEDMTILARWLKNGIEQGPRFWYLLGGVLVLLIALLALASGLSSSKSPMAEAWSDLTSAETPEEQLKVAETYPNTPVALWAKLQAARQEYSLGVSDLTSGNSTKVTAAGPRLLKALKLFEEVAKDAPKDSSQMLNALLGAARTLETRNELPEAIQKYRDLATKYPSTPEAKQALAYAKALEDPTAADFYKELYSPKAAAGVSSPAIPNLGDPSSLLNGLLPKGSTPANQPAPPDLPPPPPSSAPKAEAPKTDAPKADAPKADAPKAEAPKPEAPKPEAPKTEAPKPEAPKAEAPKS